MQQEIRDFPETFCHGLTDSPTRLSAAQIVAIPAAVEVLQVCSMLATEAIPLEVIRKGGAAMGPVVVAALENGAEALLAPLAKYSLIDWEAGADVFLMHRLVQCVTREAMAEEEMKERAEQGVAAVNAAFPYVELSIWALCERLVPHVIACLQWIDMYAIHTQPAARLCNQAGLYLLDRARYVEAEPLYRRALAIDEKAYGPDHPYVAIDLKNLALLFLRTNRADEAAPLFARAKAIRKGHAQRNNLPYDEDDA